MTVQVRNMETVESERPELFVQVLRGMGMLWGVRLLCKQKFSRVRIPNPLPIFLGV